MRKSIQLLLLTMLSVIPVKTVFSQDDAERSVIGNPTDNESAANIVADNFGNTYVGGMQNRKALIVKQNASHTPIWSKTLYFTTTPNQSTTLAFLDLIGDTVFGCGKIHQGSNVKGAFYFKMNAQTGAMYWTKYDLTSRSYFSCMRYSGGKFFLIGGIQSLPGPTDSGFGKVFAVSSQTGNMVWETPSLQYSIPYATGSTVNVTEFINATEVVNGKLFITGSCSGHLGGNTHWISMPLLVGITETGTIFMEKMINLPYINSGATNDMISGKKIHLDMNQDIVIGGFHWPTTAAVNLFAIKCDISGNLLYSKNYNINNGSVSFIEAFNETAGSYVLFGANYGTYGGSYILELAKNGNVQKCVTVSKPNVDHRDLGYTIGHLVGNSSFLNGQHYFVATEFPYVTTESDINLVIVDEELNAAEDCSSLEEVPVSVVDVPTTVTQPTILHLPESISFQDGGILENVTFGDYCDSISLDLGQNQYCGSQAEIAATVSGFTDPTFYWSNGTSSSANSIVVSTTDTVFVRVVDVKCCELFDTIVPVIVPSSFTMSLPPDTTICLQPGASFTITPGFSGANSPVQYLWSDNSAGASLAVTTSGTYWVEISDSCLTLRDSIVVTVHSLPVIGNTANVMVCEGDFPTDLNPTVSAGAAVLWDDNSTTIPRSVSGPGTYTISATNDCGTVTANMLVSQTDLPGVTLTSLIDTCIQNGQSVVLSPTFTATTNVLWSDGSAGNQLTVSSSGSYMVIASNSCGTDSATCSITINHFPELDLPAVLDTCFEVGVGFSYTAQGSAGLYQWNSGSQSATTWILQEGIYTCTLTNVCGSITDSMQVRRITAVDLYFPEDSIRDCQKQLPVSLLHIETNYQLEIFAPDGTLAGTYLTKSGWYRIHAFNPCGEIWDSIYVNLQNEQFFYLPNAFSPNADTHNERYVFQGENITVRSLRIFNRWGEEIFSQTGDFTGWDGTYKGEACPTGMYAVSVIYEDCFGMPTEFNGHVNLLR